MLKFYFYQRILLNISKRCLRHNPVEQIWRWLKPIVHGVVTVENGIDEILDRIRKIVWHWRNGSLVKPLNVGIGIWNELIINIYGE